MRGQIVGADRRQRSSVPPDGRTDTLANVGSGHVYL